MDLQTLLNLNLVSYYIKIKTDSLQHCRSFRISLLLFQYNKIGISSRKYKTEERKSAIDAVFLAIAGGALLICAAVNLDSSHKKYDLERIATTHLAYDGH